MGVSGVGVGGVGMCYGSRDDGSCEETVRLGQGGEVGGWMCDGRRATWIARGGKGRMGNFGSSSMALVTRSAQSLCRISYQVCMGSMRQNGV